MASDLITPWQIDRETVEAVTEFFFFFGGGGGSQKSLQMVIAAMKLKDTHCLEGKL